MLYQNGKRINLIFPFFVIFWLRQWELFSNIVNFTKIVTKVSLCGVINVLVSFSCDVASVIYPKRGVNVFVLTVFLLCQIKRGVHVFVLTVSPSRFKSFEFLFNLSSLISRTFLTFLCLPVHFPCYHPRMQPTEITVIFQGMFCSS